MSDKELGIIPKNGLTNGHESAQGQVTFVEVGGINTFQAPLLAAALRRVSELTETVSTQGLALETERVSNQSLTTKVAELEPTQAELEIKRSVNRFLTDRVASLGGMIAELGPLADQYPDLIAKVSQLERQLSNEHNLRRLAEEAAVNASRRAIEAEEAAKTATLRSANSQVALVNEKVDRESAKKSLAEVTRQNERLTGQLQEARDAETLNGREARKQAGANVKLEEALTEVRARLEKAIKEIDALAKLRREEAAGLSGYKEIVATHGPVPAIVEERDKLKKRVETAEAEVRANKTTIDRLTSRVGSLEVDKNGNPLHMIGVRIPGLGKNVAKQVFEKNERARKARR